MRGLWNEKNIREEISIEFDSNIITFVMIDLWSHGSYLNNIKKYLMHAAIMA